MDSKKRMVAARLQILPQTVSILLYCFCVNLAFQIKLKNYDEQTIHAKRKCQQLATFLRLPVIKTFALKYVYVT